MDGPPVALAALAGGVPEDHGEDGGVLGPGEGFVLVVGAGGVAELGIVV